MGPIKLEIATNHSVWMEIQCRKLIELGDWNVALDRLISTWNRVFNCIFQKKKKEKKKPQMDSVQL